MPARIQGGLKFLSGKRRAQTWLDMFYMRDLARARWSGAAEPSSQRRALESWQERLKEVEASESLAENHLAEKPADGEKADDFVDGRMSLVRRLRFVAPSSGSTSR